MWTLVLLAAAWGQGASDPARAQVPVPAGLSWALADALSGKLAELDGRWRAGQPHPRRTLRVTEAEIDSYVNLSLYAKLPPGLSAVAIRFGDGRVTARATVDLDQIRSRAGDDTELGSLSLLAGSVPLEVKARLETAEAGFGVLELEHVRLGGWPLPRAVLAELLASAGRKAGRDGPDPEAPFRLPYGVKRIRVEPGVAILEL